MFTVLITGVAGFVGSNLSDRLLGAGHSVHGIDDLSQGASRNLDESRKNRHFSFQEADVMDREGILRLRPASGERFDAIFHLAAYKIPKHYSARKTLEINTIGTRNLLELARRQDAVFLFSSTSDVYGKNPNAPFTEDADLVLGPPTVQRWAYAASKIYDEHLVRAYHAEYGLPFVILRYFNSFGPRSSLTWTGGPISLFIQNALEGKPITLHGDGSQKRCFCYMSDTVEGTYLALEKKSARNDTYNIGNERTERSIKEIAEMVLKTTGKKVPFQFIPHAKAFGKFEEVDRRIPDIRKAREKLGFEPKVSLEEGIRLTYEWQKTVQE